MPRIQKPKIHKYPSIGRDKLGFDIYLTPMPGYKLNKDFNYMKEK